MEKTTLESATLRAGMAAGLPNNSAATRVDGGKLIGAAAGDLPRGYSDPNEPVEIGGNPDEVTNIIVPETGFGGFLGRANGWDR